MCSFVLLLLAACGPRASSAPEIGFDGERAFSDLKDLVAIGPRPAGSEGSRRTRQLIAERLRQAGWRIELHEFEVESPDGPVPMQNVIGSRKGTRADQRILLITHYDTKLIEGIRFLGANDGASGVALLLEFARQLARRPLEFSVELVFFDGEEAFGRNITRSDGLYGSRALAEKMAQDGTLEQIRALILVDMVADADLNLSVDLTSSPQLRAILAEEARHIGDAELIDPASRLQLVDDHTPFQEQGLDEVLAVIDFQFGGPRSPGPYWHTARDDLEAVSQESLNRVGRLVVQAFNRIEKRLVGRGRSDAP